MIQVAIDGPSGVGKTSIAKRISSKLGYTYIDTGALYRALAVYFTDLGIDSGDEEGIGACLDKAEISVKYIDGTQHVFVNGNDVTDRLRTEPISRAASITSQYKKVRNRLLDIQRKLASENSSVMDGRDIGTVILPDADVKVFLTASPEIQAGRRYLQLENEGKLQGATYEGILKDIKERDFRDSHRDVAPLKKAEDAVEIDTSHLTIDEVEERILKLIEEKTDEDTDR